MYTENDIRLYHHGILGQKWGTRNGPPYPLKAGQHSSSEKKAGWKKSLGGGRNESEYRVHGVKVNTGKSSRKASSKQGMSYEAKEALAYTVLAVAPYAIIVGAKVASDYKDKRAATKRLDDHLKKRGEAEIDPESGLRLKKNNNATVEEDLKAINPAHSSDRSTNMNCTYCSMAFELRRRGFDVVADVTPNPKSGLKMLEKNFDGPKINKIDPSGILYEADKNSNDSKYRVNSSKMYDVEVNRDIDNTRRGKNTKFANEMLNAMSKEKGTRGIMTVNWGIGGGHMICYEVSKSGKVSILDGQSGKKITGKEAKDLLSCCVLGTYTRTDNLDVNYKEIRKVVK